MFCGDSERAINQIKQLEKLILFKKLLWFDALTNLLIVDTMIFTQAMMC